MVRIFHASDIHFGAEDRVALDWFADAVRAERPDAVAITGDLTMRARHREFAAACDWILSLDAAAVTVEVGNHDLPYFNPIERFFNPYKRIHAIERLVEREIDLPGVSLVPLTTTARAQARLNWSRGIVTDHALKTTLTALAAVPQDRMTLVTAHHPLVEAGTRGKALTTGGNRALAALARAGVHAVLTGHVHDPFDLMRDTPNGPIRMIGAGTLSARLRSTPPSFNELTLVDGVLDVRVRTWLGVATPDMQIDDIPADASQPLPGDAVAPVAER
jgi:3',5'-cyclic AMP phosphodiesterase CpdA